MESLGIGEKAEAVVLPQVDDQIPLGTSIAMGEADFAVEDALPFAEGSRVDDAEVHAAADFCAGQEAEVVAL